jgi:hypothetical protein
MESGGASVGPTGARSSLHALSDMTWITNRSECGRNAEMVGLIQGGTNAGCPGLFCKSGYS